MKTQSESVSVPFSAAQSIAEKYNYTHVVIYANNEYSNCQSIATYGVTDKQSIQSAESGNNLKKILGWNEGDCCALPHREGNDYLHIKRKGLQDFCMAVRDVFPDASTNKYDVLEYIEACCDCHFDKHGIYKK